MQFHFKKTAAIFMSALAISGAVLPATAANVQPDILIAAENTTNIEPKANTISLSTTSHTTSITVSWSRPSGATTYHVTCGSQSKTINSTALNLSTPFYGLSSNTKYAISVSAYNSSGTIVATGSTTATTKS